MKTFGMPMPRVGPARPRSSQAVARLVLLTALALAGASVSLVAEAGAVPHWYLKNSNTTGVSDIDFTYGNQGDFPHTGDWDASGTDTPLVYRRYEGFAGEWFPKNSHGCCFADFFFQYGNSDHNWYTLVADWNGDGIDTPAVIRNENGVMRWYIKNSLSTGFSDVDFTYANYRDQYYVAGDWNGDGIDTPGVAIRDWNCWCFVWHLKNSNTTGVSDIAFSYGKIVSGDTRIPFVGDWDGDGIDTPGIHSSGEYRFLMRNSNTSGGDQLNFTYGNVGDHPVVGDWNGDGIDTVGTIRETDPLYPTSRQYGGGDGVINTDSEIANVVSALNGAADDAAWDHLWHGLTPDDQVTVQPHAFDIPEEAPATSWDAPELDATSYTATATCESPLSGSVSPSPADRYKLWVRFSYRDSRLVTPYWTWEIRKIKVRITPLNGPTRNGNNVSIRVRDISKDRIWRWAREDIVSDGRVYEFTPRWRNRDPLYVLDDDRARVRAVFDIWGYTDHSCRDSVVISF